MQLYNKHSNALPTSSSGGVSMGGVIVEVEVVWVVAHPISAHGVEGRGGRESGQVHLAVEQGHHMRSVPMCNEQYIIVTYRNSSLLKYFLLLYTGSQPCPQFFNATNRIRASLDPLHNSSKYCISLIPQVLSKLCNNTSKLKS